MRLVVLTAVMHGFHGEGVICDGHVSSSTLLHLSLLAKIFAKTCVQVPCSVKVASFPGGLFG